MGTELVAKEIAEKAVKNWLDTKKVFDSVRQQNQADIDLLVEAIQKGVLTYGEEKNTFTHKLLHPLQADGEITTTELTYIGRLNDNILRPYLKGVSPSDVDARVLATVAALTGTAKGILSALDSVDKKISNAIAIFFF